MKQRTFKTNRVTKWLLFWVGRSKWIFGISNGKIGLYYSNYIYDYIYFDLFSFEKYDLHFNYIFTLPFALTGGILYLEYLNFNISIAVIVGFLALLGVAYWNINSYACIFKWMRLWLN